MNLLCCAGLAGLPQISVPWIRYEGLPIGLSIVGARNEDLRLVDMALDIAGGSPYTAMNQIGIR